jgi:hypothetical protein
MPRFEPVDHDPFAPRPMALMPVDNDPFVSPEDAFAYGQGISPEATWRNLLPAAELGLGLAPGSGEAMSARDAWDASGRAGAALTEGNFGEAASDYLNMGTGLLGAIPGAGIIARGTKRGAAWMDRNLPEGFNRLLDSVYPQGYAPNDTAYAIPAWHGSPNDFKKFEDRVGQHTGDVDPAYGHHLSENRSVSERYATGPAAQGRGKIYQVEIGAEPEHFVRFNEPLGAQSQYVQKALADAGLTDQMGGLFGGMARTPEGAQKLRAAGIAGVSYRQNAMPARSGLSPTQPTTNYVVFDPELLKIQSKATLKGQQYGDSAPKLPISEKPMTPEEFDRRASKALLKTQDVPDDQQIVRFK